jgi:hypothetical protein
VQQCKPELVGLVGQTPQNKVTKVTQSLRSMQTSSVGSYQHTSGLLIGATPEGAWHPEVRNRIVQLHRRIQLWHPSYFLPTH